MLFFFFYKQAAIIGSAAFLEPDMLTVPSNLFPPFIMYSDIFLPPFTLFCYILCFFYVESEFTNYFSVQ